MELKEKWKQWKEWFEGEDLHSIRSQINNMIWDAAVFLCINKARKYTPMDSDGEPELNRTVHVFVDKGFLVKQVMAIRRLLDKETQSGNRSVISLYRLINDMENNNVLLTRENILNVCNLTYNYKEEETRIIQERMKNSIAGPQYRKDGMIKCVLSENVHVSIDSLSGVDSDERKPQDTVQKGKFGILKKKLDGCRDICKFANKFVAHPATLESRASVNPDSLEITLSKLQDAHKIICEVSCSIGTKLLNCSFGNVLPIPQFDQFEHFEKPWATKKTVEKMYEFWKQYQKETDSWKKYEW